ncbi:MAG: DNA replication/repair protein RecF [Chloroflexota bacterium]|nr:DNA replication/repair protein RecF [Chloroflexota bacterium]
MALRAAPRAAHATMELTRLALTDFRSYLSAELAPDPGLTVVAGPNGTGKTNLLEAIHATIVGRSHRAGVDADLVRHGAPFARVHLELAGGTEAGGATIELVLPGAEPTPGIRKRLMVNGVPRRTTALPDVARVVLFRPEEMLLLVGSPAERRRFLDGIVAQRDRRAARDLNDVARVITQRNALLRAIRAEEASIDTLGFWDEQLAQLGARVMRARLEVVSDLAARVGPLHDAVATDGERGALIELVYLDALKEAWTQRAESDHRPPGDAELVEAYRRRIAEVRQKEAWNGVSLVGPQRDDLRAELGGRDVASHASRGQQRTIILALKLAETDLLGTDGPRPIVLLDDVFSELDPARAARLSDMLSDRGQVIVTTADPGTLEGARRRRAAIWGIDHGRLVRES